MGDNESAVFRERFLALRGNMTQDQFADLIGISSASVKNYESGRRTPGARELRLIAEKTNVSADYLLGLWDDKASDKDLKYIVEYTGLSSDAIARLHEYAVHTSFRKHHSAAYAAFDSFIEKLFPEFLLYLSDLGISVESAREAEQEYSEAIASYGEAAFEDEEIPAGYLELLRVTKDAYLAYRISMFEFSEFWRKIPEVIYDTNTVFMKDEEFRGRTLWKEDL